VWCVVCGMVACLKHDDDDDSSFLSGVGEGEGVRRFERRMKQEKTRKAKQKPRQCQ
jgi:hypothetical protein